MIEWIEYKGTDEQIDEMRNAEHGYVCRYASGRQGLVHKEKLGKMYLCAPEELKILLDNMGFTHYLICNPHPLADMIERQARTGQPVWIRLRKPYSINIWEYKDHPTTKLMVDGRGVYLITTTPDWNIPGAEYSFEPFEEEKQHG